MNSLPSFGPLSIRREQAQSAKAQAWARYASYPHADIKIGWAEYLAEIDAINALSGENNVARPGKRERKRLIELVLERDGPDCWLCANGTSPFDRTLEHLDPISRGGTNEPDNLAITHTGCNRQMGDLTRAQKLAMRLARTEGKDNG